MQQEQCSTNVTSVNHLLNSCRLWGISVTRSQRLGLTHTTTEKEALAVLKSDRYFRSYLVGSKFKLFTDHEALTFLLKMAEPKGKIARWINELQQFDLEVSHRPGASLRDADAMSRILVPASTDPSEVAEFIKALGRS